MIKLADLADTRMLPPLLQDFERLIGLQATLALVQAYGGLRIYIPTPARAQPDHPIAKIIGHTNLLALAEVYGAESHFQLPKAHRALVALRNARITKAYLTANTSRELAAEYNLTERHVERIVAAAGIKAPADRQQAQLF